jgi:peroxiredoxin Q/BCP
MIRDYIKGALGMKNATTLHAGDEAPAIDAVDHEGKAWSLGALRGQRVVLFFYPADDTPG